jgi:hypothetical protein
MKKVTVLLGSLRPKAEMAHRGRWLATPLTGPHSGLTGAAGADSSVDEMSPERPLIVPCYTVGPWLHWNLQGRQWRGGLHGKAEVSPVSVSIHDSGQRLGVGPHLEKSPLEVWDSSQPRENESVNSGIVIFLVYYFRPPIPPHIFPLQLHRDSHASADTPSFRLLTCWLPSPSCGAT